VKGAVRGRLAKSTRSAGYFPPNEREGPAGLRAALNELPSTDRRIVNAYTDGRTEREAFARTGKKPSLWHHRRRRKILEDADYLRRLSPSDTFGPGRPSSTVEGDGPKQSRRSHGRRASMWIPTWQVMEPRVEERSAPEHAESRIGRTTLIKAGAYCYAKVVGIKAIVNESDAWRRPRRIRAICSKQIFPLVESLRELRSKGVQVSLPWEFFDGENPPLSKGIFTSPDLRGTLRILLYRPSGESIWVRPSLPEWEEYLQKVASDLEPFQIAYVDAVLAGKMSGGEIPGNYVCDPSRIVDSQKR